MVIHLYLQALYLVFDLDCYVFLSQIAIRPLKQTITQLPPYRGPLQDNVTMENRHLGLQTLESRDLRRTTPLLPVPDRGGL